MHIPESVSVFGDRFRGQERSVMGFCEVVNISVYFSLDIGQMGR